MRTSNKRDRTEKLCIKKEHLALFRALFVGRADAYAKWDNGIITVVKAPLNNHALESHLIGEFRVGSYLVGEDGRTPYLVFDVDERNRKLVRKIVRRLQKRNITPYVERSKSKGFHIWVFPTRPMLATTARRFAKCVLHGLDHHKIEIFPKQDKIERGRFGNCIWLPLCGIDIQQGRTVFLGDKLEPIKKQWERLRGINRVFETQLLSCIRELAPHAEEKLEQNAETATTGTRITEGKRNSTLARLGGAMRRQGATEDTILDALHTENEKRCTPPLPLKRLSKLPLACRNTNQQKQLESE